MHFQAANRVYIMRPQLNPTVETQAIARAHRRGQTRPVTAVVLASAGTVDDEVLRRQDAKRDVIARLRV